MELLFVCYKRTRVTLLQHMLYIITNIIMTNSNDKL